MALLSVANHLLKPSAAFHISRFVGFCGLGPWPAMWALFGSVVTIWRWTNKGACCVTKFWERTGAELDKRFGTLRDL